MSTQNPVPVIPEKDLESMHDCLVKIVVAMQGQMRQVGNLQSPSNILASNVTVQDLLDLGLIDQNDCSRLGK